ncbi:MULTISPECIES: hypothetical protein [unclassified Pseudomonas]|uniref:hypothetical protein n=1 Tax=unclassified Pseudomonas TaxID=196821 RepID=UPI000D36C30A|nr:MULTISPECIES: hypothetical protein [unclassified Pseudomonas]RAU45200.1 hypothetical protein DBP26_014860 [Pseudomonas sp. RIT 409]RAU51350.1 hypothetical protein DBY65_019850 [Pseudomonas sp. RIT 412]
MTTLARNKVLPAATPATDIRSTLAKHRTTTVDRFVVDKTTGEMLGCYTTHDLATTIYDYEQPQIGKTQAVHPSYELDPAPRPNITEAEAECLPDGVADLDAQRSERGPKPKVTPNQYASHLKVAHAERHRWIDDYVHGACMTVAGVNNGKMNVSPSHVTLACMLDEISTEIVKKVIRLEGLRTMSDQQARRICQCARFAIDGMEFYLERNPIVRQQLQFEVDFAKSYRQDNTRQLQGLA